MKSFGSAGLLGSTYRMDRTAIHSQFSFRSEEPRLYIFNSDVLTVQLSYFAHPIMQSSDLSTNS